MKRIVLSRTKAGRQSLGCAAVALLALPVFGQTLELKGPAPVKSDPSYGEQFALPDLPAPEWQVESGVPVARLRIKAADAAAWRVEFRSLALGKHGQMFLYGTDAGGAIRAMHGPYEGNGPENGDGFEAHMLEGVELAIEVRGKLHDGRWPFEIGMIERLDAPQLEALRKRGIDVEPVYRPVKVQQPGGEVRTAWFHDQLVHYKVADEYAIAEGDIVLGLAAEVESGSSEKDDGRRKAHEHAAASSRWPKGVIPYTIQATGTGAIMQGTKLYEYVQAAINVWNTTFPGILVLRTNEPDYVTFTRDNAGLCRAQLGHVSGQQRIWLKDSCLKHKIVHEIGHALGMWHEHQRPDRDQWVTIMWQNIEPDMLYNFELPRSGETRMLGIYDYDSVMHYTKTTLSVNGEPTIVPKQNVYIGDRSWPSEGDQAGIRSRYCNPKVWSMPSIVYVGPDSATRTFTVTAPPYCTWTISETASWLTISGALTRTGTSTVTFTVPWTFQTRMADVKITSTGSDTVRIEQEGENLNF